MTAYALWIAEEIGLNDEAQHSLRIGGRLHDVGKIGVPDDVLRKPGRLTEEEFDTLKQHPTLGALIVAGVPGMRDMLGAVRHHTSAGMAAATPTAWRVRPSRWRPVCWPSLTR